jgi:hypothetical protein
MSSAQPILAPETDAFRREFARLSGEAAALVEPLDEEQFNWRPASGAWSVSQCLEHLNIAARMYLPMLDEGIATAIRLGLYGSGPFAYHWIGRLLVWSLEPPPRFKARAPAPLQPEASRPARDIVAGFQAYQMQFIDRLHAANGLDLARARVRSPVASWLRVPLGSGFAVTLAHERRHLWQARQTIKAHQGRPG